MQRGGGGGRGRGGRNPISEFRDPFAGFGMNPFSELPDPFAGFPSPFSDPIFNSPFGGASPFSDPFFANPFGPSMFGSSLFRPMGNLAVEMRPSGFIGQQSNPEPRQSRGPIIEEINSDDEKEDADNELRENPRKHRRTNYGAYVEDPDDAAEEGQSRHLVQGNKNNTFSHRHLQPEGHSFTFHSSSVTYGGPNGAYYTSSKTRRTGSDGISFEESKEADTTTGRATHNVSKALHNKGHSVSRKLNPDGKVDTMQTLHNLNEDELSGFEQAWKGAARKRLPGFGGHESTGASSSGYNGRGGRALLGTESSQNSRGNVGNSRQLIKEADAKDEHDFSQGSRV